MSETGLKKKNGKKKKRILRRILWTLALLVILAGAGIYTWAKLKDQYTVTYDEYTATTGTISNSLSFSGNLALRNSQTCTAAGNATVRNVYVKEGDSVKKGDRLVRLSTGTTFTADFDGKVNQVSVENGDEVSSGAALGNVAYYTATAHVDVDGEVYPGMQVTVTIPQEEAADVVILKAEALSFTLENQAFVYKMKEDQSLEEVQVQVGVSNGNYVEIKSGLESGEKVYTVSETKEDSLTSLFAGMFGQQRFNRQNGRQSNRQNGEGSNWQGQNGGPGGDMPSRPDGSSSGGSAPGGNGGGR